RVNRAVFTDGGAVGGGAHDAVLTVSSLMNTNLPPGCLPDGCPTAAFGSYEHVYALATDGWTNLTYLNSLDFAAFALSQKPPGA
ncbi:MAG: hypothetical protein WCP77_15140, partial [Roseococcus sp.]